jgi:cytochrome c551/c552
LKVVSIGFVAFLLLAQLVPIDRTNPSIESDVKAPPEIDRPLRAACYDCHSNETVWPWYSHVAPISWLLAYDVKEGRAELNFSTWQLYDAKKEQKKLKEIVETMNNGEMPPWYYVIIHAEARLVDKDHQALVTWASQGKAGSAPLAPAPESGHHADSD